MKEWLKRNSWNTRKFLCCIGDMVPAYELRVVADAPTFGDVAEAP